MEVSNELQALCQKYDLLWIKGLWLHSSFIYRYRPSVQSLYYRRYQSDSNAVTASLFYYRTSIAYQRTKLNKVGLTLKPASQSESKADCHRSLMTDCYCVMNLHFGQLTDFGKLESGKRANAEARKMPSNLIVCWVLFLGSREEREGNHKNKIQLKQNKPFSRSTWINCAVREAIGARRWQEALSLQPSTRH